MIAPITTIPTGDAAGDQTKAAKKARKRNHRRRVRARRRRRREGRLRDLQAADFKCRYCGADLLADVDALVSITWDHLVPRSRGGTREPSNLVVCCSVCNKLKAAHPVEDVDQARALIDARRRHQARILDQLRELAGWREEP